MKKQMNLPFDLLLGRKTFEIWAPFWPQHADMWPGVNTATKYVASNTMTSHEWQPSVFLSGDIAEKVSKLKQQPGPDLHVYGSANLVQTLMKHDLVDEFWLKIYPLTLGSGKRLFADGTIPAAFKVTESTVSPSGIIIVNYERAGAVTTGTCINLRRIASVPRTSDTECSTIALSTTTIFAPADILSPKYLFSLRTRH